MAESFENVKRRAAEAAATGIEDGSPGLRQLDPRRRRALELFRLSDSVTSRDIEKLFGISQRTARHILSEWAREDFPIVLDPAKKTRKYGLATPYWNLLGRN